MSEQIYAIMGASGQIGRELTEDLLRRGHTVRALGRSKEKLAALEAKGAAPYAAAFDDAAALMRAFTGASAVFVMIPPAYEAEDFSAQQDKTGEAIAAAIRQAQVTHVMDLSSLGAQHPKGTGPIAGLHRQEKRLEAIPGVSILHFRPGYFMENLYWSIPLIKAQGINGSAIRADVPLLMVATKDIAAKAAEFLNRLEFDARSIVELSGPGPVTMNDATAVIGRAISKPDLKYVQFPYDVAEQAMAAMGMKPKTVKLMIEMQRAMNDGRIVPEDDLLLAHGPTSIDEFAAVFSQAYQSSEPAPV